MSSIILPKRLRQLLTVAARGLETPTDANAIYFLLLAQPQSQHTPSTTTTTTTWHLVCRSSTVHASSNPEWDPIFLADTHLPEHILNASQVLIIALCCYHNHDNDDNNSTIDNHDHQATITPPKSSATTTTLLNNHTIYTHSKDIPTIQLNLREVQSANNTLHLLQTAIQPFITPPTTTTKATSIINTTSVVNAAWYLNLHHLHYLGDDLGKIAPPSSSYQIAPHTVILEYGDGYYAYPPPLSSFAGQGGDVAVAGDDDNVIVLSSSSNDGIGTDVLGGESVHPTTTTLQQQNYSSPVKLKIKQIAAAAAAADNTDNANGVTNIGGKKEGDVVAIMNGRSTPVGEVEEEEEGSSSSSAAKSRFNNNNNNNNNGAGAGGKRVSLSQLQQCILSLSALKERTEDLRSLRDGKCRQLELLKSTSTSKLNDQKAGLRALCQETQAFRLKNEVLQRKAATLHDQLTIMEQAIASRTQALATTLKVAQTADKRVNDARLTVAGEAGHERLVQITKELVVRRCLMVCQVCKILRLGPSSLKGGGATAIQQQQLSTSNNNNNNVVRRSHLSASSTTSPPPPPPSSSSSLTEVLEVGWAGAQSIPSITAGNPDYLKVDLTDITTSDNNSTNNKTEHTSNTTITSRPPSSSETHTLPPPPPALSSSSSTTVLSIGGLKVLDPEVVRKIFTEDYLSSDPEPDEDKALSVALGYVALLVDRLAAYLEVPLKYPIKVKGSVSSILDGWDGQTASSNSSSSTSSSVRKEYPLHCFGGIRERGHFGIGVFLLNKNVVQLLQMHGIGGGGASQLLGNLYKLFVAAKSAV